MARQKLPIAVIGLGRFGTAVAIELSDAGFEVLAVDSRPDVVQRLSGRLSQVVCADATDIDALRDVGLADFMRAVVAIGDDREASILSTSILSELGVDDIWAKALNDQHSTILRRVGADHVIMPEQDMGERLAHLLSGGILDYFEVDNNYVVGRVRPSRSTIGERIRDVDFVKSFKVSLAAVKVEFTESFAHPDPETVLTYGTELLVCGSPADIEAFAEE